MELAGRYSRTKQVLNRQQALLQCHQTDNRPEDPKLGTTLTLRLMFIIHQAVVTALLAPTIKKSPLPGCTKGSAHNPGSAQREGRPVDIQPRLQRIGGIENQIYALQQL